MDASENNPIKEPNNEKEFVRLKSELETYKRDLQMLTQEMTAGYAYHKMIYDETGQPIDYIFLDVNAAFEKLTGLKKTKIKGKSVREVLPGVEDYWIKKYGDVAKTGLPLEYENYSAEIGKYFLVNAFSSKKGYFSVTFVDSTASHITEDKFKKNKNFFKDLIETVKEGVWVSDKNDIIHYVNTGMTAITGAAKSEMMGKSVLKDFSEETIKEFKEFYIKAKEELKPIEYEAKVKTLSNRYTYQSGWLIPITRSGKFDGMICSILDITEQKENREIIKKREEQLSNIIDHSTNAFYSHTPDHVITYFSPQIEKIIGYKPEEALVKWTSLASDNPINEKGLLLTNKAIETGEVQEPYEVELIHKNGALVRVEVREAPVVKEGKTVAIVGSLTDITERTRIADELKISQEGLRNLVDNSPVAIAINDQHGKIEYLNKEFVRAFGYTTDDIKHVEDWWLLAYPDPGYRQEVTKRWKEELKKVSIEDYSQKPFEVTITCKNNQRKFVQIQWSQIGDDLLLILNNLTEQKILQTQLVESNLELKATLSKLRKANTELKLAKQKAEESDHLKSAFLANMSHEIRTPMNSIIGFSSLLTDQDLTESKRERFSDLIQVAGQHLLRIIDDIIDISKIESNQLKIEKVKINVFSFLEEVYNYHDESKLRNKNPELKFNLIQDIIYKNIHMLSDQIRLKQLFDNLITNAFKNTIEGKVEFGIKEVDEANHKIIFFVKDTGVGIPKKYCDLIFNRFLQVENQLPKHGTGLGLSITKGIIDLLDGKIWFKTKEQIGTTFYFEFSYDPSIEIKEKQSTSTASRPEKLSAKTIFIAEDDFPSFVFLREILNPTGAEIHHFTNGLSLVEEVTENEPDLILVDINMPIMNGLEAVKQIRNLGYNGPVIAQTAYAMQDEKQKCLDAKCDDYISKPINIKSLLKLVHKYIGTPRK
ncbi:PAS domain S-box protein [Sunxiuqinia sp. A32]|uniref:PAS domain S-box protein n=1 Tax=Sunxiuqinia sp. A32 TaxID=3461496 RepID=UPI0040457A8A